MAGGTVKTEVTEGVTLRLTLTVVALNKAGEGELIGGVRTADTREGHGRDLLQNDRLVADILNARLDLKSVAIVKGGKAGHDLDELATLNYLKRILTLNVRNVLQARPLGGIDHLDTHMSNFVLTGDLDLAKAASRIGGYIANARQKKSLPLQREGQIFE